MTSDVSADLVVVDGSRGEGGGQILRSSLALSMITGRPTHITRIRAGRTKPGLLRQHLTAVTAAARICRAAVTGAKLGSMDVHFQPQGVEPGHFEFAVGSAGSTTLVLQTILPALMLGSGRSTIVIDGGTHNPWAPPFEFLEESFAPCIALMGPTLSFELERPGFHPAGGGRLRATIDPVERLRPLSLRERGLEKGRRGYAVVAHLSELIGQRELVVLQKHLDIQQADLAVHTASHSHGPGNAVWATLEFEHVTEIISAIGEKSVRAERVARSVTQAAQRYLESSAPVGPFLADQLILPMAIAGSGVFRATRLTRHASTNVDVIRTFVDTPIAVDETDAGVEFRFGPNTGV